MGRHWIDELADQLYEKLVARGKDVYVFNGGLSVSGLQHVGRLRGEIIVTETLRRILSARGLKINQYLTLYTQDAWKAKDAQVLKFGSRERGIKYAGWPLVRVPDPHGCHANWVEHYWADFGPYISEFTDGEIEVVTTTELYTGKLLEFAKMTIEKSDEVRKTINKYRGRKPYPEGWVPFEPICEKCGRIDTTEAIKVIDHSVEYVCNNCGYRGTTSLSNGKLMWRIEWVGVWWSLGVDFEPYGKDHAMPGGSRDSCVDLAVNVYSLRPPEGLPYEWVEWRTADGKIFDMGSSDFLGFTPRDWLEVAHPHILRFLVLKTPPMKKLTLSLREVPQYYSMYFKAERVYYRLERASNPEEEALLTRSYELSYPRGQPPQEPPEQVPYLHIAILAQIIPPDRWSTDAIAKLKASGHLPENPTRYGVQRVLETVARAYNWVLKYGPDDLKFRLSASHDALKVAEKIPCEIRGVFRDVYESIESVIEWNEDRVRDALISVTSKLPSDVVKKFYEYFYLVFTGKPSGPRAAPLLSLLGREKTLEYLSFVSKRST